VFKKISYITKFLLRTKFIFGLPKKNKILLFDEIHSLTFQQIIKKDFNILQVRKKKIFIWIFIKQVLVFDFKFTTYCKNYVQFTSPKVVICFNDARLEFYELKRYFENIKFIIIMNGVRVNSWFERRKILWPKNLKCDYFFTLNEYLINKYKQIIDSKYCAHGHFLNNLIKIGKTKYKKEFLYISQTVNNKNNKNLLKFINLYLNKKRKKLHILLRRSKNHPHQSVEIQIYKKIFKSNCIFLENTNWKKKYKILDKFENIVFTWSTMGYEAISRKKKIIAFVPGRVRNSKFYFGWPGPDKKKYSFFSTKKITYNEVSRILNNVYNCSQANWNSKYYKLIQDQFNFDQNNQKLKNLVLKLIKF
jgi:hypothetical protein